MRQFGDPSGHRCVRRPYRAPFFQRRGDVPSMPAYVTGEGRRGGVEATRCAQRSRSTRATSASRCGERGHRRDPGRARRRRSGRRRPLSAPTSPAAAAGTTTLEDRLVAASAAQRQRPPELRRPSCSCSTRARSPIEVVTHELRQRTETLRAAAGGLPAARRATQGEPLRALLEVIAEQAAVVEEDIDQLYDDLFIETCAEWVVPYIGDLIGVRGRCDAGRRAAPAAAAPRSPTRSRYRRRKGTAAVLEQLARDVTGWPARGGRVLPAAGDDAVHEPPAARQPPRPPDLRRWRRARTHRQRRSTRLAHTAEVRRIASGRGRYNIPNVGLFLFRLQALPLRRPTPSGVGRLPLPLQPARHRQPLFTRPAPERSLTASGRAAQRAGAHQPTRDGGRPGRFLRRARASVHARRRHAVPAGDVVVCDLATARRVGRVGHTRREQVLHRPRARPARAPDGRGGARGRCGARQLPLRLRRRDRRRRVRAPRRQGAPGHD